MLSGRREAKRLLKVLLVTSLLTPSLSANAVVLNGPHPCHLVQGVLRRQRPVPSGQPATPGSHDGSLRAASIRTRAGDGTVPTWGPSYRAASAQDCCDKCKSHKRLCNSWTFCGLPVCWGLDTGHKPHTHGECWLRRLADVSAESQWRQRGQRASPSGSVGTGAHEARALHMKYTEPWACSPIVGAVDERRDWAGLHTILSQRFVTGEEAGGARRCGRRGAGRYGYPEPGL